MPGETTPIPGVTITLPAVTTTLPAVTTTMPGVTTTMPGMTTTMPGVTTTMPGMTTTLQAVTTTMPGVTTTMPGVTTTLPAVTTTLPAVTTTMLGVTTTMPGMTTTLPAVTTKVSGATTQPALCHGGWSEHNNHCYKLFRDQVIWSTANEKCKGLGANLASVTSADENNFITQLIANAPKGEWLHGETLHLVWFGLKPTNGRWKWTDGSALSYRNWAPREPGLNPWGKTMICGNVYSKDDKIYFCGKRGQWNDTKCFYKRSYICKKPK
ncbi:uncharacterized protein LOC144883460 [Branchiostoma floridae x Branchiostoma japonicum]